MKESENWKEETTQHWFSYFQLPASTKSLLWLSCLRFFLMILVYDYKAIGLSSVVYIFHKSIISYVLCGYEV